MNQEQRRLYLIKVLLSERAEYADIIIPDKVEQQKALLRALVNVRTPETVSAELPSRRVNTKNSNKID